MKKKFVASTILAVAAAMALTGCVTVHEDPTSSNNNSANSGSNPDGSTSSMNPIDPNAKYTYRTAVSGNPNTWNPHEWETNDDSIIMSFTTAGLYEFVFNEKRNGYEIVPEMADGEPVDVTSTLTLADRNRYGLDKTATEGLAWAIDLREEATWENGEPINADSYIYSMKQILNPDMMNYRANSYYSGSVAIGNAKDYYNGGHEKYNNISSGVPSDDGSKKYFSFFEPVLASKAYAGETYDGFSLYDWYMDDLRKKEFQEDFDGTGEPASGYVKMRSGEWGTVNNPLFIDITDTNGENYKLARKYIDEWCVAVLDKHFSDSYANNFFFYHTGRYEKMDFEGAEKAVGIKKTGDYQITIYSAAPTTPFDFKYNFSSNWLVKEDLYEANKTQIGALTKTTYGTEKEKYMSYGPYILTSYQKDKIIHLSRNEKYFGYKDKNVIKPGEYQATDVDIQIIPSQATQLQMFLNGQLDDVSLVREDINTYGASSRISYSPNTYTSKVTFNTDWDKLVSRQKEVGAGCNKTIATNIKFREAFFWSLNRKSFCQTLTAGSSATVVPLNSLYVADVNTGESYRSTEQAQNVVKSLVGDNANGYDVAKAKKLFQEAYDEEIASTKEGHLKATDDIVLEFKVYNSEDIYNKMISFFQKAFDNATKGTDLEGKILIKKTVDPNYYDTMQAGNSDLIYTTWGGAQLNPYGLLDCYCDSTRMFEYGFKPEDEQLTITLPNGADVTMSYADWAAALDGTGGEYSAAKADKETRLTILSAVELALCKQYRFISVYARSEAYLTSFKLEQGVDEYVPVMGYGGIRYYKFNFSDDEWAEYLKTHKLDYRQ